MVSGFSGFSTPATIARAALDAIVAHAREAGPAECCGLLVGTGSSIAEAARTKNIADDARSRFLIDPKDHIDGRRGARRRGLEVIGFYHSHPESPALPSATDQAEATYSDHLYLIVSLVQEPPDVSLFTLDPATPGNFLRLPFVTVG
jgi:proteasome lid subunit RPN8/RPN11